MAVRKEKVSPPCLTGHRPRDVMVWPCCVLSVSWGIQVKALLGCHRCTCAPGTSACACPPSFSCVQRYSLSLELLHSVVLAPAWIQAVLKTTATLLQQAGSSFLCVEVSAEPMTRAMPLEMEAFCWHPCTPRAC